jgi:hypothetical protein
MKIRERIMKIEDEMSNHCEFYRKNRNVGRAENA